MLLIYVKIYKYFIVYTCEISIAFHIHVYVNIFANTIRGEKIFAGAKRLSKEIILIEMLFSYFI